ncbi:MAG: uroporphyrinogen-III synthase [Planctomycetes bacterium]|nr:uroporphyrinogen-III synthase [Planctomycetota bacterium]
MGVPRVLVTGPVEYLDEWCAAARAIGWEAHACPLITIEEHAPDAALADALAAAPVEFLCVTSAHAIEFLAALGARAPYLRTLGCAVVGQRSVSRLRAHGFRGELNWHASAQNLVEELLAREARPKSLLWPRGDRSDELARTLRAEGIRVEDPLAYTNRPRPASQPPPRTELVFFASPSAVRAWSELGKDHPAQRALAIGPTTLEALLGEKTLPFFDIISLPEPTPSAFAAALQHIDLRPTS